jgi:hypothetical protein
LEVVVLEDISHLILVRIGNNITFSSLRRIGIGLMDSFGGMITDFELSHHEGPDVESIDAQLLTMILHQTYGGHTLGITDADLRTRDEDVFYNTIIGGKNVRNDVAVVSTRKLAPPSLNDENDYALFIARTLKVALHEVGHNFGLTDHSSYRTASDGTLCPMSRGEFNKFGYRGYVKAVVDGRGLVFCEECTYFLRNTYGFRRSIKQLLEDGLVCTSS